MALTNNQRLYGLIGFLLVCFLTAAVGGYLTSMSIRDWYPTIEKPAFTPPNMVFPIVWNLLYMLLGISGWSLWSHLDGQWKNRALALYGLQLVLNILWSALFFSMQHIHWALMEIILTWLLAVPTLVLFFRHQKRAGWLMLPYVLWLSFAVVLNYTIWTLNS